MELNIRTQSSWGIMRLQNFGYTFVLECNIPSPPGFMLMFKYYSNYANNFGLNSLVHSHKVLINFGDFSEFWLVDY